jgi:hypothetical protein
MQVLLSFPPLFYKTILILKSFLDHLKAIIAWATGLAHSWMITATGYRVAYQHSQERVQMLEGQFVTG